MKRLILVLLVVVAACSDGDDPAPVPTPTPTTSTAAPAPATTAPESDSGVLSARLDAWSALGMTDYDLEYRLEYEGGGGATGTYRSQVRDGEPVNCFLDEELSMRLECDSLHYTVESIFARIISGDARDADVIYDPQWHYPATVDHDLRPGLGASYTLEVLSFTEQEPVDWVAYVQLAVDWLEENYDGAIEIDWEEARADALALVEANPRRINAFTGIERLTQSVRGALFRTPREVGLDSQVIHEHQELTGEPPTGERMDGVGYLRLPGPFSNVADTYALTVYDLMTEIDAQPVCGWVIDLRDQHFYDVPREVVALGPLLGEGTVFTYSLGDDEQEYSYMAGSAYLNGQPVVDLYSAQGRSIEGLVLEAGPYDPSTPNAPMAVLTSIQSSIWPLVTLDALPHSRVFGQPAQGGLGFFALGSRRSLDLPLGAKLYAPTSGVVFADIDELYDPRPDEIVLPIPDSGVDEVLEAALAWLDQEPACAS